MRNFYYLCLAYLLSNFAFGQWTESFELDTMPPGWTVINNGDPNGWVVGEPQDIAGMVVPAQDGTKCAKINFDFSLAHDDYLITPPIMVTTGVNGFLSFYAKNGNASLTDVFSVLVSTTTTDASAFTEVALSNIVPPESWTNYQVNLNSYNGQQIYVAFYTNTLGGVNLELDIDNVESFAGPNCPDISNIAVDENTGDTVTLSWDYGSSEMQWDIEYGPTGFTPTGVPTVVATSNPYTVEGLTSNVTYDFYIRANCGGTDIAQWVGPFTVTTIINYCAGAQFTDSGGAGANYQNNENETYLIAPVTAGDRVRVTFTAFNVENNWDFLRAYDGPNNTYPPLHPGEGFTGVMGTNTTVPSTLVSTDPSGALFFEFTSDTSVNRPGWVADVVCEPIPSCPDITQLIADNITGETADLSWNPGNGQFSWSIEYGPVGFTPGTGTVITGIDASSYTLTGLDPLTEYSWYVQGECADSDFSVWAGPANFVTGCATFVVPYLEDFTDWLPGCWEEASNGTLDTGPLDIGSGSWNSDGWMNNGFTGAAKINLYATGINDWLITPFFDLGDGSSSYQLKFDIATMAWGSQTDEEGFSDDDKLYVMMYSNGAWTVLETFDSSNTPIVELDHIYPLTGLSGLVQFAFYGTEGEINDTSDVDVFIDNFRIEEQPACPQASQITVTDVTTESATVTWVGPSNAVEYTVIYVPAGGEPETDGIEVTPNPTTNTTTITGLMHSTPYDVYVTVNCGETDGLSLATGPVRFQTKLPNDDCATAVELTSSPIGETCSTAVAGSITGALDSGIEGCVGTADDDVWYTFEAISNRQRITLSEIEGTTTDLNFEIFSGADCENLTSVACSDPVISVIEDLVAGETYYVRVFSAESTPQNVTYNICITALYPEAPNGLCSSAIEVTSLPYSNSQFDYVDPADQGGFVPGCAGGTNDGLWYTLIGDGGDITVEVNPTNGYNPELGIYSSCPGTADTVVGCSSSAGTDGTETVVFSSVEGQEYYINIGQYNSVADFPEGDFDINIFVETASVEDLDNTLAQNVLYPNPTSGVINYSGDKLIKSVVAYDLHGGIVNSRIVISQDQAMDLSSMAKGIYIMKLNFDDGTSESFKVIKQ